VKLTIIALASAFAHSSRFALAKTVRHKPSVRTYDLHRGIPLGRSGFLHPNYGNPDGATSGSAGGLMWNGRSASEWGRRLILTARAIRAAWYQDLQST
jgi:hypothetical protein